MRYWLGLIGILCLGCGDSDPKGDGQGNGGQGNGGQDNGGGEAGQAGDGGGEAGQAGDGGQAGESSVRSEPDFTRVASLITVDGIEDVVTVTGKIRNGRELAWHTEEDRSGTCRLLTYQPGFCDPECPEGQFCIDGSCAAEPALVDGGNLILSTLVPEPVTIEPRSTGVYWWQEHVKGVTWGDGVQVEATGGDIQSFRLGVQTVTALEPEGDYSEQMQERSEGEDVVLRWSNPDPNARISLYLTTGIGSHGGISPVDVECDAPDQGELTIPGEYLDALYGDSSAWSCGECGVNDLYRYRAIRSSSGDDQVELRARMATRFFYQP